MRAMLYIVGTFATGLIAYAVLRFLGVGDQAARIIADMLIGIGFGWRISSLQEQVDRLRKRK